MHYQANRPPLPSEQRPQAQPPIPPECSDDLIVGDRGALISALVVVICALGFGIAALASMWGVL